MGRVPHQRQAPQNAQMKLEYSNSELGKSSDTHALEFGGGAAVPHFLPIFGNPLLLLKISWRAIGCHIFTSFRKTISRGMMRFKIIWPETGAFWGNLRSRQ